MCLSNIANTVFYIEQTTIYINKFAVVLFYRPTPRGRKEVGGGGVLARILQIIYVDVVEGRVKESRDVKVID